VGKSQTALQRQQILDLLGKHKGAALSLADLAGQLRLQKEQVLTLLGQLKGQVECVSKATMEEGASMKWTDVDSKWRLVVKK
jgi:hypothetical protein